MATENTRRQLILGGGAALGTIVFLAIVIAVQYIVVQHPKRWDLTKTGKFTLAQQSRQVVNTFKEKRIPVQVLAFYETKDMGARERVRDLLEQYRELDSSLEYRFVDPDKERSVALMNKIESYPTIVIRAADKTEQITQADEEAFTNALMKLLRTDEKTIYFLSGHGELAPKEFGPDGFSTAKEKIEKQNYKTKDLVLLQASSVPDDATILIVAGPQTDPIDSELVAIKNYLGKGGKLLVLLNPFKTPKLAAFLKDYGFELKEDIVVDRMSRAVGGDYLMPLITKYGRHPITDKFSIASFFPEARSVSKPKTPVAHATPVELAFTSAFPASWTIDKKQLETGKANYEENAGTKGPVSVMAVSTYTNVAALADNSKEFDDKDSTDSTDSKDKKSDDAKASAGTSKAGEEEKKTDTGVKEPPKARLVVFGSAQFASNKFIGLSGNPDLFMNTVSWLAEEENLIAIRPKSTKAEPVLLTRAQSHLMFILPVVVVPLIWFLIGVVVYFYRRMTAAGFQKV